MSGSTLKITARRFLSRIGVKPAPSTLALTLRGEGLTYLSDEKLLRIEAQIAALAREGVEGCFVEFGVALGGGSVLLARAARTQRRIFHGFDVFSMIPEPASEKDDAKSRERYEIIASGRSEGLKGADYYGYVDDLFEQVCATMTRFDVRPEPGAVDLHKGLFEDTVPRVALAPVALAHVDCDWYDPVAYCLAQSHVALAPGGRIVLDDYHDYGGCRTATDEFLLAHPEYDVLEGRNLVLIKARSH